LGGFDNFKSGLGNDTLDGGRDGDALQGGAGNDTLYGSKGFDDGAMDVLWAGDGDDWLEGGDGDILLGDLGSDILNGGWAYYGDYVYTTYDSSDAARFNFTYTAPVIDRTVNLVTGTVTDGIYTDTLFNIWKVTTGNGNDTFFANAAHGAWFSGGGGVDTFYGNNGDDTLLGGADSDNFVGSGGSDLINGEADGGTLTYGLLAGSVVVDLSAGTAVKSTGGTDTIQGVDHVVGSAQSDTISGNGNANSLYGGAGNDILRGGAAADVIDGGSDQDRLEGGDGNDTLSGGDGNDVLVGDVGGDYMAGGAGDDEYWVDSVFDTVFEYGGDDQGHDTIHSFISCDISQVSVEDVTLEGTDDTNVLGNQYANRLVGNSGKNFIDGGAGADAMIGGYGDDTYIIDDLDDLPQEFDGTNQGIDTAWVRVANFDARKLANIENIIWENGGTVDTPPEQPAIVDGTDVPPEEGYVGRVMQVHSDDDAIGGPLQYEILSFSDLFSVDSDGWISLNTALDFENLPSGYQIDENGGRYYAVQVRAVETSGALSSSDVTTVNIYVLNADEAPNAPSYVGTPTIAENQDSAGPLLQVIGSADPDGTAVTYMFAHEADANPGNRFVVSQDGTISLATGAALDYEAADLSSDEIGKYYTVKVIARDATGTESAVTPVKIYVTDVNEEPGQPTFPGTPAISENLATAAPLVQLDSTDPEGATVTYALAQDADANPGNRFVVSQDGKITLANATPLNYEAADLSSDEGGKYYTVKVIARDAAGNESAVTPVKIYVTDVNEAPTGLSYDTPLIVMDNAQPGDTIADAASLTVSDPDSNPDFRNFVYVLVDDQGNEIGNAGAFAIDHDTGELMVGDAGLSSVTASGQFKVRIKVTDEGGDGLSTIQDVWVTVNSTNAAPVITAGQTSWPVEDVATVAPFKDLSFADAEDDAAGLPITFHADFFGQQTGTFENLPDPANLPDGITLFEYTEGDHITITGSSAAIRDLLQHLQFNPNDRPAGDGVQTTAFNVYLVDQGGAQSKVVQVTVDATATGLINHSPVIVQDPDEVIGGPVFDDDTIQPFAHVSLTDQDVNDELTVQIEWQGADGSLTYPDPAAFGVTVERDDAGLNQLWFKGTQANVTAFLKALEFSPDDFPNDAYQTSHPVNFILAVTDQHGATDSTEIGVDVQTQNRTPTDIGLDLYGPVDDSFGVGRDLGSLHATDPNSGDFVAEYALVDDPSGLFDVIQRDGVWVVVVKNPLDAATLGSDFTIKVAARDQHQPGLWSEPQDVQIHIEDSPNHAPQIVVDPNGRTTWDVKDTDFVAPFRDLTFVDVDDQQSGSAIGVTVLYEENAGIFLPVDGDWSDLVFTNDAGVLAVYGLQERVTAFLKHAVFNPSNTLTGTSVPAAFDIIVQDSQSSYARGNVTVNIEVTNSPVDNAAPVISGSGVTNTTDWGQPVQPFLDKVTLTDAEGDDLTLTVTFREADGTLGGLPEGYTSTRDVANGLITYSFTGSAVALVGILNGITFDATGRDAPGPDVTTTFTLAVNDGHHPFPAENGGIQVVTAVTGPSAVDNTYDVFLGDETFGEDPDPILGGHDTANVHYTGGQYVLDEDDGIELLVAADDVTAGINVRGNNLDNTLIGSQFDDTLDGGSAGQDVLRGGLGNDTYVLSRTGVTIEEDPDPAAGTDTVQLAGAWAAYTLGQGLERLDASGATGQVVLTGNGLGNEILGNAEANILNGGEGNDTLDGGDGADADNLLGGTGDDTYRVRHAADAITEGAGEGTDTVEVYFSEEYHLASSAQVEVLKAGSGIDGVHLVGNGFSAALTGSGGADTLDGGTGASIAHTLDGGQGDDVYYIVNAGDEIEGERDLAEPADNGTLNGLDTAYLYRGLYATDTDLQAAIEHYLSRGIETVVTLDGVPETDDNLAPTNVRILEDGSTTALVPEHAAGGTGLHIVADDASELEYEMLPNASFGIDQATGEILVLDSAELNFEGPQNVFKVYVRAREKAGDQLVSAWQEIVIDLQDENDAPTGITFDDRNVIVGAVSEGDLVSVLSAQDEDADPANLQNGFRFADGQGPDKLVSADGLFRIDAATGQILINKAGLDETDAGLHHLTFEVFDQNDPNLPVTTVEHDIVVQPDDGNAQPTNLRLVVDGTDTNALTVSLGEDVTNETLDLRLAADDPGGQLSQLTYWIEDNAFFELAGGNGSGNGQIRLKDGVSFDYETHQNGYTVKMWVIDRNGQGLSSDHVDVTILMQDRNDGPESVAINAGTAVKIGDGQDIVVATAAANDPDGADSGFRDNHYRFVYTDGTRSLTSQDGLFVIDADTGEIKTAHLVGQDPTDGGDHVFTVEAYDGDGNAVTTAYTVTVGPANGGGGNSAPSNVTFSDNFVREHLGVGLTIGVLDADDAEDHGSLVYTLVDDGGGRVELFGNELRVKDNTKIDFEQVPTGEFSFTVSVSDGHNPAVLQTFTLGIENIKAERVTGTTGDDTIVGGSGNDVFNGAGGNDTLSGGTGQDALTGGVGADTFQFNSRLSTTNVDRIQDFDMSQGDTIELASSVFANSLGPVGTLSESAFVLGTEAVDANSRIIYDQANGKLWFDRDGLGGANAVLFATFQNTAQHPAPTLTHEAFFVI
jgi:Ca2+-binding RTX toxin-like protein